MKWIWFLSHVSCFTVGGFYDFQIVEFYVFLCFPFLNSRGRLVAGLDVDPSTPSLEEPSQKDDPDPKNHVSSKGIFHIVSDKPCGGGITASQRDRWGDGCGLRGTF